jgi:hypothetical protein
MGMDTRPNGLSKPYFALKYNKAWRANPRGADNVPNCWLTLHSAARMSTCVCFTLRLNFSPRMHVKSKVNYETGGKKL